MSGPSPDVTSAAGSGISASLIAQAAVALVALTAAIMAYSKLVPGYLIQPISSNLVAAIAFVGTLAALALVYRWVTRLVADGTAPGAGQVLTIVAAVGLIGYKVPLALARAGVQIVSFASLKPVERMTPLSITGSHYAWWAKRGGFFVDARVADTGYVVSLPVTQAAYDAIHAGDRVMLPVETGRNGVRRIVVPVPLGLAELRPF